VGIPPPHVKILAEMIQAGGEILVCNPQTHSAWNEEEFPDQWKESVIVPVHKKG
jgi:hypothetical protein